MTGSARSSDHHELVKVVQAGNEAEAELVQGRLCDGGIISVVRRAPAFDVPDMLAAGPRDVLVSGSDLEAARELLLLDAQPEARTSSAGVDPPSRVLVALLITVALVAFVVCIGADVLG